MHLVVIADAGQHKCVSRAVQSAVNLVVTVGIILGICSRCSLPLRIAFTGRSDIHIGVIRSTLVNGRGISGFAHHTTGVFDW